jgi:hypothetical protein
MRFQMCLLEQSHIYVKASELFTEHIHLPPNVICIKCSVSGL